MRVPILLIGGGTAPGVCTTGSWEIDGAVYTVARPGIIITSDGLDYPGSYRSGSYSSTRTPPERDEVETAKAYIAANCRRTKTIRPQYSSYSWKHRAEKWGRDNGMSPYVSNGALIQAAVELDVRVRPTDEHNINAYLSMVTKRKMLIGQ